MKKVGLFCVIALFWGCSTAKITTAPETGGGIKPLDHFGLLIHLLSPATPQARARDILNQIAESGDTRFVAGLIDLLRYHLALNREIGRVLNRLTGQDLPPNWENWVEWAGKHPEMKSFSDYPA